MEYIVNTPCGAVQGVAGRVPGTVAFKGIRYATAGRWEYPQQVTAWEGVYDATAYAHCSYQMYSTDQISSKRCAMYSNPFRR